MLIAESFTIDKIWKQPQCPSRDEQIKVMLYICTMENYSAMRKKDALPFETAWMDLEQIMLSKSNRGKKNCMISFIWNLKTVKSF